MAAANNRVEVLKALISYGIANLPKEEFLAFLNEKNAAQSTALHWSALSGAFDAIKV